MFNDILNNLDLPARESRFLKPPAAPFVVYFIDEDVRGGDGINLITEKTITFELYADKPNADAESMIAAALDAAGVEYTKTARNWIESEGYYQTVYTFDMIEKKEV